jgi:hypothetical protein
MSILLTLSFENYTIPKQSLIAHRFQVLLFATTGPVLFSAHVPFLQRSMGQVFLQQLVERSVDVSYRRVSDEDDPAEPLQDGTYLVLGEPVEVALCKALVRV